MLFFASGKNVKKYSGFPSKSTENRSSSTLRSVESLNFLHSVVLYKIKNVNKIRLNYIYFYEKFKNNNIYF